MKKLLLFLTPLLLLLSACTTKPSFDTSLLIGKWYAYHSEYEDGIESTTTLALAFTNENEIYIEAKVNIDGDYFCQITCHGEYKVNGDII